MSSFHRREESRLGKEEKTEAELEEMIWLSRELASGTDLAPLTAEIVLRYGQP